MPPTYLVRFDDICPTMNWEVWGSITEILRQHDIRPILAVVPDNCDPTLMHSPPRPDFWEHVREWQKAGWTIALHGYQHLYVTGDGGIMNIKQASEFAGLSLSQQRDKLKAGLDIFQKAGVRADAWIAPGHSFDHNTVAALLELGVDLLVDGFARTPYVTPDGMRWIPQQLWDFWPVQTGVWTVCYHHNNWSPGDLEAFRTNIARFKPRISSTQKVVEAFGGRRHGLGDKIFDRAWRSARWSRSRLIRGFFKRVCR